MKLTLPYPQSCKTPVRAWNPAAPDSLVRKTFSALCHIGRDLSCSSDTHEDYDDFGLSGASWSRVGACNQGNQVGVTYSVRRGQRRRGVGCALATCRLPGNLASVLETPHPNVMPTVTRPDYVPKNGITLGRSNSTAESLRLNRVNTPCVTKGTRGINRGVTHGRRFFSSPLARVSYRII